MEKGQKATSNINLHQDRSEAYLRLVHKVGKLAVKTLDSSYISLGLDIALKVPDEYENSNASLRFIPKFRCSLQ